jgi:hypothetical protein
LVAINQMNAPLNLDLSSISNPVAGIVLMFVAAFAPYMSYKFISFVGFDLYHAMSAETEAKAAMNRPVPVPAMPALSNARKVLGGGSDADGSGAGGSGSPQPGGGSASSGRRGGDSSGTPANEAGAEGAAAGPEGMALVAGAQAVTVAAKAGPETGKKVANAAEDHTDASHQAAGQRPPGSSENEPGGQSRGSIPIPPAHANPSTSEAPPSPTTQPAGHTPGTAPPATSQADTGSVPPTAPPDQRPAPPRATPQPPASPPRSEPSGSDA